MPRGFKNVIILLMECGEIYLVRTSCVGRSYFISASTSYSKWMCKKSEATSQAKYAVVETVATSQAFNFGLAKNEASYGKFCLCMLIKSLLV